MSGEANGRHAAAMAASFVFVLVLAAGLTHPASAKTYDCETAQG